MRNFKYIREKISQQDLDQVEKFNKHGKKIPQLGPDAEGVLKDMQTDINMPFVLKWDKETQEFELIAKTIMRKKGFKTSSDILSV